MRLHAQPLVILLFLALPSSLPWAAPAAAPEARELSRPAHPWQFFCAVGRRSALLGYEDGRAEAWVYPLKLVRNFHLKFHTASGTIPAEATVRSVSVRPEASTIIHSGGSFSIRQTWFAPPEEPGAIIRLEIDTHEPLEVEAVFERDFQLMWPAGLGGTYMSWDEDAHAYYLGEEQGRFFAYIGSPAAHDPRPERSTHLGVTSESSFRLAASPAGRSQQVIVFAASFRDRQQARETYDRLAKEYRALEASAADYYRQYLANTVALRLPDARLERAYDWARVSVLQGMVSNPFLGTGLIAGYGNSGNGARPGFAWYFGRDSEWTAFALNAMGDFTGSRQALEFIARFQREDGKMPHEISQSAKFVPWFEDYPYDYASADATPLYILASDDYARRSGDWEFARANWERLWKAYSFMRSTYDALGFAKNLDVGHGWVEGGPLLPVRTELYQAGLGVAAIDALKRIALEVGKKDVAAQLAKEYAARRPALNDAYWLPNRNSFAFAYDTAGKPVDVVSVLVTAPMWFDVLDAEKSSATITHLAAPDHLADWGSRILSSEDPLYDPTGYHFGSVWPLFTGWAAVGEYRQHRPHAGYANLAANALLTLEGPLGHTTEVLSGDYFDDLPTSSPHQIWSAAMVISPLLRGLLGLEVDAANKRLRLAPHLPADWPGFEAHGVKVGRATLDLVCRRTAGEVTLEINQSGAQAVDIEFAPAFSLHAKVSAAEINQRPVPFEMESNREDQHARVRFTSPGGRSTLRLAVEGDFDVAVPASLPLPGSRSRNLKLISQEWNAAHDRLTLEVAGLTGEIYALPLLGGEQVAEVEGAELSDARDMLLVSFKGAAEGYEQKRVAISLRQRSRELGSRTEP